MEWTCLGCNASNISRNRECFRCGLKRGRLADGTKNRLGRRQEKRRQMFGAKNDTTTSTTSTSSADMAAANPQAQQAVDEAESAPGTDANFIGQGGSLELEVPATTTQATFSKDVDNAHKEKLLSEAQYKKLADDRQTANAQLYNDLANRDATIRELEAKIDDLQKSRDRDRKEFKSEMDMKKMREGEQNDTIRNYEDKYEALQRARKANVDQEKYLKNKALDLVESLRSEIMDLKEERNNNERDIAELKSELEDASMHVETLLAEVDGAHEEAAINSEAARGMDTIGKRVEHLLIKHGEEYTVDNIIKRLDELEESAAQAGQTQRAASGLSVESFGEDSKPLPRTRGSMTRKVSVADELAKFEEHEAVDTDDEADEADEAMTNHMQQTPRPKSPSKVKASVQENTEPLQSTQQNHSPTRNYSLTKDRSTVQAQIPTDGKPVPDHALTHDPSTAQDQSLFLDDKLTHDLNASQDRDSAQKNPSQGAELLLESASDQSQAIANGKPVSPPHVIVREEQHIIRDATAFEALQRSPWWMKLVLMLMFLTWAGLTFSAWHERNMWLDANVTYDMISYYQPAMWNSGFAGGGLYG